MTALTEWGGEIEVAIGLARTYPSGEWDTSLWDAAEWDETDTTLGDWLDVTCDTLVPISLKAGSSKVDGVVTHWEAATATISFTGDRYDPRVGPWADKLGPGLPVRIRWRPMASTVAQVARLGLPKADEWRIVFLGDVPNGGYKWDPAEKIATLQCQDKTADLVAYDGVPIDPPVGGSEWASARIHRLADMAYVPDEERDIVSGGVSLLADKLSGTAWSNMLKVADTDIALLWIRRDGRLAFRPEGRIAENVPLAAVLVACPDDEIPTGLLAKNLLLNDDQASSETTLVWEGWGGGMTVARSNDRAAHGGWSAKVTPAPNGYAQATPNTASGTRTPVTPGVHTVMVSFWEATAHSVHQIYVQYFDEAGTSVGTAAYAEFPDRNPGGWIAHRLVFQVPTGATRLILLATIGGFTGGRLTRQITNDFEASIANYTSASANLPTALDSTVVHGGTRSLQVTRATSSGAMQVFSNTQTTANKDPISPGQQVTLSCWVRHNRAAGPATLGITARFNLGNAGLVSIAQTPVSVPANTWTYLTFTTTAPPDVDSVTFALFSTVASFLVGESLWFDDIAGTNDTIAATDVAYYDRAGVFAGDIPVDGWTLPSWEPPDPATPIGYVNLLHNDPTIRRNWVTIARRKIEGTGDDDPLVVTRIDGASVSRFRPQTYRQLDLEHEDDQWSNTVADLVLADGAWPTTAPSEVELDTRTHGQATAIASLLLGLEPEHVFSVEDPLDRAVQWRMLTTGWDVDLAPEKVSGSILLDDVTGWGTAAGWDDPAPPHGWDIDTWALVGAGTGGGGGSGTLPTTITYALDGVKDIAPPGALTPIPLVNPGTGQPAYAVTLGPGTYQLNGSVVFDASNRAGESAHAVRAAIAVGGNEMATASGTTSATQSVTVLVAITVLTVTGQALIELNAQSTDQTARAIAGTRLAITQTA